VITGVDSGSFAIVIQDQAVTSDLTLTSTGSQIASALNAATGQLSSPECTSFSATIRLTDSGKNAQISVTFNVDNSKPLSLLSVYSANLVGNNVTTGVSRTQLHSVLPGGRFEMSVSNLNRTFTTLVPFNAEPNPFRSIIQNLDPAFRVSRLNTPTSSL
jgi:hypothetical protein